jgi:hypothetical protein
MLGRMTDYIWGDAEVTYPDWQGTIQVDERRTGTQLDELVGLDFDRWGIVGIDIGGGESAHTLHVLAVDKQKTGDARYEDVATANGGDLPVTDFLIHDADPYAVLQALTHVLELRMRVRSTVGLTFRVAALGDVPEQD